MTEFTVWAPDAGRVRLRLVGAGDHEMVAAPDGWWRVDVPTAGPGTDYAYLLGDDDRALPDPRSPWQPEGVHGCSRVYDHAAYTWSDQRWTGRQLPGGVLYELHVGTFTPEGTFDSAIERLDHLVDLGVDLIELLPVNAFNGEHNWGYDGVCWFAPHHGYGGPDGLKRLVDAAHARGLGVILDVVYNHFGPSGAYAPLFGPYLAETSNTWGRSVNLDGPHSDEVRRYIVDSIIMWLRDYHLDGLRLDAVHALRDQRAIPLLEELGERGRGALHPRRPTAVADRRVGPERPPADHPSGGRRLRPARAVERRRPPRPAHPAHRRGTGLLRRLRLAGVGARRTDRGVLPCRWLVQFPGARSRAPGRPAPDARSPVRRVPPEPRPDRQPSHRGPAVRVALPGLQRVGATLLLTAPFTPMLFMGEEWAASTPWQFFTSHPEPELAAAVATGRRREFAAHGWSDGEVPDPQDPQTFARSRLDWAELDKPEHREMLDFYRRLIALRRSRPDLSDPGWTGSTYATATGSWSSAGDVV